MIRTYRLFGDLLAKFSCMCRMDERQVHRTLIVLLSATGGDRKLEIHQRVDKKG